MAVKVAFLARLSQASPATIVMDLPQVALLAIQGLQDLHFPLNDIHRCTMALTRALLRQLTIPLMDFGLYSIILVLLARKITYRKLVALRAARVPRTLTAIAIIAITAVQDTLALQSLIPHAARPPMHLPSPRAIQRREHPLTQVEGPMVPLTPAIPKQLLCVPATIQSQPRQ